MYQWSYSTSVSTGMGDRLRWINHLSISSGYPGQLSLLPSAVLEMSTSQSAVILCCWGLKADMIHYTCGWTCVWQVNSLVNMPRAPYLSALEMSHYKAWYKSTDTLLYWWFGDRKDIRPIETCATCAERFFSWTSGRRKPRGNWLTEVHLDWLSRV